MRRFWFILWCMCSATLMAQNLDVTEYTQNLMLSDTTPVVIDSTVRISTAYPLISETYQIPAYGLYNRFWDVENLRSRALDIPFSDDRLMLLLVQEGNHPFQLPCTYNEITQHYGSTKKGEFHPGVDLSVEYQTLVRSCFDGVVRMAKPYGPYGLMVVVRHYNGLETVYAHLDKLCVRPGQIINAGDIIGQAGKSGKATDCTLHFETRFMNEHFNPELMIDFDNEMLIKNSLSLSSDDIRPVSVDDMGDSPSGGRTSSSPKVTNPTDAEYHIVQKGESLYRISLDYHTTIERILQLNNLENPDKISEGQKLRVK